MSRRFEQTPPLRARVPSDVERPDKVLFGLSWRQVVILAVPALLLYAAWSALATVVHPALFLAFALPVAGGAFYLAVGRREGIGLDVWLLAALRHRRSPHRLVPTENPTTPVPAWIDATAGPGGLLPLPAPLRLPAKGITSDGLVDLGPDGTAALVDASTVAFGLRSTMEQTGLVAGFARWLHGLDGPAQILVRAARVDLTFLADRVTERAPGLPHPALEQAAVSHAQFLAELASQRELLHRRVTVVVRGRRGPAHTRHLAAETARALAACEVATTVLDGPDTATRLAASLDPAPPHTATDVDGGEWR